MNVIYFLNEINEIWNPDILTSFDLFFSPERKERVKRAQKAVEKKKNAYSELLIKLILQKETGLRAEDIRFRKNAYGKLYLAGYNDVFFNVSHSFGCLALAVSTEEIGIDVEKLRPAPLLIPGRFFSEDERTYIFEKEGNDVQSQRFFEIWTKKESYVKKNGRGLSQGLSSIKVMDKQLSGTFFTGLFTRQREDYFYCVCSSLPEKDFSMKWIKENEFLKCLEKEFFSAVQ